MERRGRLKTRNEVKYKEIHKEIIKRIRQAEEVQDSRIFLLPEALLLFLPYCEQSFSFNDTFCGSVVLLSFSSNIIFLGYLPLIR